MDSAFDPTQHPHRRLNLLTGEWVLNSPHRLKRPWQGQVEEPTGEDLPSYDPQCYLCPGNSRAGGHTNPDYDETFVFTNDFAALLPDVPAPSPQAGGLLRTAGVRGECRVLCFSPRHDLTLALMSDAERRQVVDLWAGQFTELARRWRWVQIFENRGELMGASNPHPHGQVWALDDLPHQARLEDDRQREHHARHGTPLLLDYARLELELAQRVVERNDHWLAVVPFWATWPYETLLLPLFRCARLDELDEAARDALAAILGRLLARYDNLFRTGFPYSMGWHCAPTGPGARAQGASDTFADSAGSHWQLHAHFYPPLLRSASVRKHMVGFELLGEAQRDLTPEQAAARLLEQPTRHYRLEAQ